MLNCLIENIFVYLGRLVIQQAVGVQMDTNCASQLSNLVSILLWCSYHKKSRTKGTQVGIVPSASTLWMILVTNLISSCQTKRFWNEGHYRSTDNCLELLFIRYHLNLTRCLKRLQDFFIQEKNIYTIVYSFDWLIVEQ